MASPDYDIAIIGGGFYGCSLALFLRSLNLKIIVLEAEDSLMTRASRVNQARVHTGFHYPRSFVTAIRSGALQKQFSKDFQSAVISDFDMLYAISKRRSKVSSKRFLRTFQEMNAPIEIASRQHASLFNPAMIDGVFKCREYAFDWSILREQLLPKLDQHNIEVEYGQHVTRIVSQGQRKEDFEAIEFKDRESITAGHVFNITYSNINYLLKASGIAPIGLKHEITEVALVEPPPELSDLAVTVMDGPFFSVMPYPSKSAYSLTHVRYTPHKSWLDDSTSQSPYAILDKTCKDSKWYHMMLDAKRYMPCLEDITYKESLFEVKTVLLQNEKDDGRPIFYRQHKDAHNVTSVMGAKIDNIYDLFETIKNTHPHWAAANDDLLVGAGQ